MVSGWFDDKGWGLYLVKTQENGEYILPSEKIQPDNHEDENVQKEKALFSKQTYQI